VRITLRPHRRRSRPPPRGAVRLDLLEEDLAEADLAGRDLDACVFRDGFEGRFQREHARWLEENVAVAAGFVAEVVSAVAW
jgi:hypothetical protein